MSIFMSAYASKEEVNSPQSSSSFASVKSDFLLSPLQSDSTPATSPVDVLPSQVAIYQQPTPQYAHRSTPANTVEFTRPTGFDYPLQARNFDAESRRSPQSSVGSRFCSTSCARNMTYGVDRTHGPVDPALKRIWFFGETVKKLYELDSDPERTRFLDEYFAFMKMRGVNVTKIPVVAKLPLDLYRLYFIVQNLGGFAQVVKKRRWSRVVRELDLPSSITSAAFTLRTQYIRLLYPFECEKRGLPSDRVGIDDDDEVVDDSRDGSVPRFDYATEHYVRRTSRPADCVKIENGSSFTSGGRLSKSADNPLRFADARDDRLVSQSLTLGKLVTDAHDHPRHSLAVCTSVNGAHVDACGLDACGIDARTKTSLTSLKDGSSTPVHHVYKRSYPMDGDLAEAKRSRSAETELGRNAHDHDPYAHTNVRPRSLDTGIGHASAGAVVRSGDVPGYGIVSAFAMRSRGSEGSLPKVVHDGLLEGQEIARGKDFDRQTPLGKPPLLIQGHLEDEDVLRRSDATMTTDMGAWNHNHGGRHAASSPLDFYHSHRIVGCSPVNRYAASGGSHGAGHGTLEIAADGRCQCFDCVSYRRMRRCSYSSPQTTTGGYISGISSPVASSKVHGRERLADEASALQDEFRCRSSADTEFSLVVNERTAKYLSISIRMNGIMYRGTLSADFENEY